MSEEKKNSIEEKPINPAEVEKQAASTLLDEKVSDFQIKGLGTFGLKPMKTGTMLCISKYIPEIKELNAENVVQVLYSAKDNVKPVLRIAALGILNSPIKIFLFTKPFAVILQWYLNSKRLRELIEEILSISYGYDFFVTTVLLQRINATKSKTVKKQEESSTQIHSGDSSGK